MQPPAPNKQRSLAEGIALIVVGLVIFVPSGLCTGFLFVGGLLGADANAILGPLIIGGPFVFGGGWLLLRGFRKVRGYPGKPNAPDQF